jgi:hypothetical protein
MIISQKDLQIHLVNIFMEKATEIFMATQHKRQNKWSFLSCLNNIELKEVTAAIMKVC